MPGIYHIYQILVYTLYLPGIHQVKTSIWVPVLGQDFSAKRQEISANRRIFCKFIETRLKIPRYIQSDVSHVRTETYPILETFLFLFTTQRFGGVGALEGREKGPDHIFLQIKKKLCFWRTIMESTRFFC